MAQPLLDAAAGLLGTGLRQGAVLGASDAADLVARFGLASMDALMRALLPLAQSLARPSVSNFRVGAVGLERRSGALVLGANLEFSGTTMAETVHAEQFLFARAFHRGEILERVATSARPCGHCRQFMAEFAGRERLVVLDPEGDGASSLAELLPHFFSPADLGETGAEPVAPALLDLALSEEAEVLRGLASRAHAPYSRGGSAALLRLADGVLVPGVAIENVAYNPSFGALQSALVNLVAAGGDPTKIRAASFGAIDGPLDSEPRARQLLAAVAPAAAVRQMTWDAALSPD
jgi:cytidine deaminase